jgi:hypothetical protein
VDNKPGQRKKYIFTNPNGELNNIESLMIIGLNTSKSSGYPKSRKIFGLGENYLLTFGFKDSLGMTQREPGMMQRGARDDLRMPY